MQNAAAVKTSQKSRIPDFKIKRPYLFSLVHLTVSVEKSFDELTEIITNIPYAFKYKPQKECEGLPVQEFTADSEFWVEYVDDRNSIIEIVTPSYDFQVDVGKVFKKLKIKYFFSEVQLAFFLCDDACERRVYGDARIDEDWYSCFLARYDEGIEGEYNYGRILYKFEFAIRQPELGILKMNCFPFDVEGLDHNTFIAFEKLCGISLIIKQLKKLNSNKQGGKEKNSKQPI